MIWRRKGVFFLNECKLVHVQCTTATYQITYERTCYFSCLDSEPLDFRVLDSSIGLVLRRSRREDECTKVTSTKLFFHFSKAKTLLIKYFSHLLWESNLVEKIRHLPDIIKLSDNIFVKEILVSLAVWLIRKNINKGIGNKWAEENGKHPWIIKINYRFSQFLDLFFAGIWCFQHFGEWSAVIRKT